MLRTAVKTKKVETNIEDVKSLMAYSHYLIMKAQLAGNLMLDGHLPSPGEEEIAEQCRSHAALLASMLQSCRAADIAPLLECYDALYRLGHRQMPAPDFINSLRQRIISAFEQRDRSIPESHAFATARFYEPGGSLHIALKDKWLTTLRKFNRFPDADTFEAYQRLALLMQEPGADRAEQCRWYDANRIDDISAAGSLILESYRRYVITLFPAVLDYESQQALDTALLEELARRPDLSPHARRAHTLALLYNAATKQA